MGGLVGTLVSRGLVARFLTTRESQFFLWGLALVLLVVFYTERPLREIFEGARRRGLSAMQELRLLAWLAATKSPKLKEARAEAKSKSQGLTKLAVKEAAQQLEGTGGQRKFKINACGQTNSCGRKPVDRRHSWRKPTKTSRQKKKTTTKRQTSKEIDGAPSRMRISRCASLARRKVVLTTKVQRRIENWKLPELSMLEDPPDNSRKN